MLSYQDPLVSLLYDRKPALFFIGSSFRPREIPTPSRVTELVGRRRQLHCVA
jgi:hypothetical protein